MKFNLVPQVFSFLKWYVQKVLCVWITSTCNKQTYFIVIKPFRITNTQPIALLPKQILHSGLHVLCMSIHSNFFGQQITHKLHNISFSANLISWTYIITQIPNFELPYNLNIWIMVSKVQIFSVLHRHCPPLFKDTYTNDKK